MPRNKVSHDWWPDLLRPLANYPTTVGEHISVASIDKPLGKESYRCLYSALVPVALAHTVLTHKGGIGYKVDATGPSPFPRSLQDSPPYAPKFWITSCGAIKQNLEPLTVAWEAANCTYIAPDQGFLMTYGLTPRVTSTAPFPEIHWDDLEHPTLDVVISRAVSRYGYASDTDLVATATEAFITIRRDYLQDYASLRGCSIIHVYYAQNKGPISSETSALLGKHTVIAFEFPGRKVDVHLDEQSPQNCLAAVWGSRQIIIPGPLPIAEGREDYGTLVWPGIEKPMTAKSARATIEYAYVRDTVLGKYEGRPEYTIIPEFGCVSYREQWDTGNTTRVCRDIIQVELKKLYEGCPSGVVQHWHSYAVDPPNGDIDELASEPNVAARAHKIAYGLAALGESLSKVLKQVLKRDIPPKDIVGLSKQEMDYRGWWLEPTIGSVAYHIPLDMTRDQFLSRCAALDKFLIEAIQESHVRAVAICLDASIGEDDDVKSIGLLAHILRMARVAIQSGLMFGRDSKQIIDRITEKGAKSCLPCLVTLHRLRIAKSHRGTTKDTKNLRDALEFLQIDEASTAPGWGHVLDALMDKLADEIDSAASDLERAIDSR